MSILLRLLLAHIIADFFLQTKWMVEGKENGGKRSMRMLTLHSIIHSLMAYLIVGDWSLWYIAIVIFLTHFIIDWCKIQFRGNSVSAFLIDQLSHVAVILVLWMTIIPCNVSDIIKQVQEIFPDNIWMIVVAYAMMLRPSAILMSLLLKRWQLSSMANSSLPEAGKWIGYLERILILTFVITDNMEGVGFLLAAKSVFRFGDLNKAKDIKTTEYVMLGTMTSFAIAIIVGLLVKGT